jgi:hypothetical protein
MCTRAIPTSPATLFRFTPHTKWLPHHAVQYITAPLAYGFLSMRTRIRDFLLFFDGKQRFGPVPFNYNQRALEIAILLASKLFFVAYRVLLPAYCGMALWRVLLCVTLSDLLGSAYLAFLFQCNHVAVGVEYPVADDKTHNVEQDWAKMQLATTQDYGHNSFMTYFMTGALNYQVTHHLFPYISQGHYRELAIVIQQYCREHKVEYVARDNVIRCGTGTHWTLACTGRAASQEQKAAMMRRGSLPMSVMMALASVTLIFFASLWFMHPERYEQQSNIEARLIVNRRVLQLPSPPEIGVGSIVFST